MGERAQGSRALRTRGRVLAEPEVLDHERGAEAALVVVGGGHVGHDPGDRVVGVDGPATAGRGAEDRGEELRVQTEAGSLVNAYENFSSLRKCNVKSRFSESMWRNCLKVISTLTLTPLLAACIP